MNSRMLLRSLSNPVLDCLIGHQTESELNSCLRRCRSVQMCSFKRVQSDTDLNSHTHRHAKLGIGPTNTWSRARWSKSYGSSGLDNIFDMEFSVEDVIPNSKLDESPDEEDADNVSVSGYGSFNYLTSMGSGSAAGVASQKDDESGLASLVVRKSESGLEYAYSNGGYGYGNGGGGGGGYGDEGGSSGSDSSSTDAYYQRMLEANPHNPLLLRNYARFLHEVQHDLRKAEEYYGRAILASPCDGDALSFYAKLIWDVHKDAPRAESYFDRAVEAAPDDCYVLGSYAHFLWNSGDEEEDAAMKPNNAPTEFFATASAVS